MDESKEQQGGSASKLFIGILIVLVLGLGGWYFFNRSNDTDTNNQPTPTTTQTESEDVGTITYQGESGKTALALLRENVEDVETEESSFGEYVTSINGVDGGTDNKYWIFYVNGETAQVGAAEYETTPEDTIEWKFE